MSFFLILTAGFAASIDGLMVGTVLGMKKIRVAPLSLFLISLIPLCCSFAATVLGNFATDFISARTGNVLSGLLLMYLAFSTFLEARKKEKVERSITPAQILTNPATADFDKENDIKGGEGVALGFAVAIDAMAVAFSCGLSGSSPIITSLIMGGAHLVMLAMGVFAGGVVINKIEQGGFLKNFLYLPSALYLILAIFRIS